MLSNLFKVETEGQKEYRRLIEREKLIIPENKILMIPQIEKIIMETVPSDSSFGRFLSAYFDVASDKLRVYSAQRLIPRFGLPIQMLEEDLQRHILGIGESASLKDELKKATIITAINSALSNLADTNSDEYMAVILPDLKPQMVDGYYLAHISMALAKTALFSDNLASHEKSSISRDEGKIVLNFWRAIERTKDYGDYFPDKKPPTGNKPDDKGGAAKVTSWVEGKLGGLKPADAF